MSLARFQLLKQEQFLSSLNVCQDTENSFWRSEEREKLLGLPRTSPDEAFLSSSHSCCHSSYALLGWRSFPTLKINEAEFF